MDNVVGVAAAVSVGLLGTWIGFDEEGSFYPVVLIVIAACYVLLAVAAAGLEFRRSAGNVVAGLALHGVLEVFHHVVITNPGAPAWRPGCCLARDATAAAYPAGLIRVREAASAK